MAKIHDLKMSDSGSNPESQRRDSKSQSLFHAAIGGYSKGPSWNKFVEDNLLLHDFNRAFRVDKSTHANATELYEELFKRKQRLYSGSIREKRLLVHALLGKAPDALINIMLDQKPDEVGIFSYRDEEDQLPLEIAIYQDYSLDIVKKIFILTKEKIDEELFNINISYCLRRAICHFWLEYDSRDCLEKCRQTVLFLLHMQPTVISDATPEYAKTMLNDALNYKMGSEVMCRMLELNKTLISDEPYEYANGMLKDALNNEMGSEVMCRILELNNKLLDRGMDHNDTTFLFLILENAKVDDYIDVLNMMATISKKYQRNYIAHQNLVGVDALDIVMNENCSKAVINSLCGFYGFSDVFQTSRPTGLLDYVSYDPAIGPRITLLYVNFATYAIIGTMNEPALLRILFEGSKADSQYVENRTRSTHLTLETLNHSILSMAINAKYGFDVITEICNQFPSAVKLRYTKRFPTYGSPVTKYGCNTFPFHDLLYARLYYTRLQHEEQQHNFPNVESYRRLYADIIVQPSLDKTEWHTLFYRLLGEGSLDYTEIGKLHRNIATTPMFWDENHLYPLEFVVRLGLGLTYVKTLYEAYPEAIEHNNYAVIFHSLRCRNNGLLYEDVILYLLKKLKKTIWYYKAPWNGDTALSIAEQEHCTLEIKNAIKEYTTFVYI